MKTRARFYVIQRTPILSQQAPTRPHISLSPQLRALLQDTRITHALLFATGVLVGLVILGWWLWPVQWTSAWPVDLAPSDRALYLQMVGDLYSYQLDPVRVARALNSFSTDAAEVCALVAETQEPGARIRLVAIAAVRNGYGCPVPE